MRSSHFVNAAFWPPRLPAVALINSDMEPGPSAIFSGDVIEIVDLGVPVDNVGGVRSVLICPAFCKMAISPYPSTSAAYTTDVVDLR